jgi:hypothetical protein
MTAHVIEVRNVNIPRTLLNREGCSRRYSAAAQQSHDQGVI